jgi:hypothetical protein
MTSHHGNPAVVVNLRKEDFLMFIDPISIAANSPTPGLTFSVKAFNGEGSTRMDIPHQYGLTFQHSSTANGGERHYMQIAQTLQATNPLTGGVSLQTAKVSLSVSIPSFGWAIADKVALVQALIDTLNDSDVTITGLLNFNS